jgi:hypothetical protein
MALPMYPEIPADYVRQTAAAINAFFASPAAATQA